MTLPHPTENGGRERTPKTLGAVAVCLDPKRSGNQDRRRRHGEFGLKKLFVWLFEKCNKVTSSEEGKATHVRS